MIKIADLKRRFFETIEQQLSEVNERPHRIQLGCAFGIGVNFVPTFGIGFVFAYLLAAIFKANRASAAVTSLATGPLVPLMYALNLVVGGFILTPAYGKDNIIEFIVSQYSTLLKVKDVQQRFFGFLDFFGSTFLLGSAVNALIFGTALYFFAGYLISKRSKRPESSTA